jgi:Zn-dependent peptidase ImmA (M78 family)/DNA-binding XRE family transcriptional regulator
MFSTRLRRARKAAGLSLRDVGGLVGLSHAAIKKYEDGVAMPASDVLLALSRALNVRAEYFFRPELVELEGVEYRKRGTLPKKRLDAITHELLDQVERRLELENLFPTPPVQTFSTVSGLPAEVTALDDIERAAECVRAAWKLGLDPIPDLIDLMESQGIRVFMLDAEAGQKFDGLAAHVGGMPIVVVGRHWPGDRQRFTLAHELGHLVLNGRLADGLAEEAACNRFAGAFLFPAASVVQKFGMHRNAVELQELALLKEEFGLSMSGILFRLRDLGIVSPAYRDMQAKLFSMKGWHVHEPGTTYRTEKAHLFEQLVFHALAEEYIGEAKAAELLNLSLDTFRRVRSMDSAEESLRAADGQ